MDTLRNLFKNKDKPFLTRLALLASLGAILFVLSVIFLNGKKLTTKNSAVQSIAEIKPSSQISYEKDLEERLSTLLSKVDGAGDVEVMITISYGNEVTLAKDQSINETILKETDSTGGSRENHSRIIDDKTILIQSSGGGQEPIILKEIQPKIEGIVIVAQGGDDVLVKEALMNAAKTVLGVEIHKVQVLKMK